MDLDCIRSDFSRALLHSILVRPGNIIAPLLRAAIDSPIGFSDELLRSSINNHKHLQDFYSRQFSLELRGVYKRHFLSALFTDVRRVRLIVLLRKKRNLSVCGLFFYAFNLETLDRSRATANKFRIQSSERESGFFVLSRLHLLSARKWPTSADNDTFRG